MEMMVITSSAAWTEIYYIDKLMLPHASLAQPGSEHLPYKQRVAGSNPAGCTNGSVA